MQKAEVTLCVLGPDARIYPCGPNYKGPPGPIVAVDGYIQTDEDGPYQNIRYFYGVTIRVPPLETWPEGASIPRPDPRERNPLTTRRDIETIRSTPEVRIVTETF
jgi:hypothetical protein